MARATIASTAGGRPAQQPGRRRRHLVDDLVHRRIQVVARERRLPGQHFVEHGAEGEDVRAAVRLVAGDLFGRHVLGRSEYGAGHGQRAAGQLGDAEIGDLHAAVGQHHDVRGLDIAMHDPAGMGEGERVGDGGGDLDGAFAREAGTGIKNVPQRAAIEELHRDPGEIAFATDVVDGDDVRVVELACRFRLAEETLLELLGFLSGNPAQATVLIATMRSISGSCAR